MNRSLTLVAFAVLHLQAWATDIPTDPTALAKRLCAEIDPAAPGMGPVAAAAGEGHPERALELWRDATIDALRRFDPGPYNWHGDQLNGRRLAFAEYAVGRMDAAAYEAVNPPATGFFNDRYGIHGDGPIDWLPAGVPAANRCEYTNFFFAIPLVVRYWQGQEAPYAEKFFRITQDFAIRQRDLVMELPAGERRSLMCAWNTNAASALSQGDRVTVIIRSLAVLAKSLPDGNPKARWADVLAPRQGTVSEEARKLFPAVALAQIVLSLLHDHPQALLERYLSAGAVPNQRRNGLAALLMTCAAFPEFRAARTLREQAAGGMKDYLDGAFWPDGGMLEQSFNYNLGDAISLGQLAGLVGNDLPGLAHALEARKQAFLLMLAALRSPLGKPPALSSSGSANPPPLWRDDKTRNAWFAQSKPKSDANDAATPSFTSIAFPFSGYYVQRGGWDWTAPWLFFQGSRPSRGHCTAGNNAIQICAYGRPLLVSAGVPYYGPEQLPVELRPEIERINDLFGEQSSWKVNTVLVDGGSQFRPKDILQRAVDSPVEARVLTGGAIDYLEGSFTGGYTAPSAATGMEHRRQVVFLRDPGLWLVVDALSAADGRSHTYQQNWILPAAATQGQTTVAGFPETAVTLSPGDRRVRTTDADGPNISLIHLGQQVAYARQFGERTPWRGWFREGFGGMVPAHQIQATFSASGPALLITVIVPRPTGQGQDPEVVDLHPGAPGPQAGCRITLPGGRTAVLEVASDARPLRAGPVAATAQLALAVTGPEGTEGLVITLPRTPGSRAIHQPAHGAATTTTITVPAAFSWRDAQGTAVSYEPPSKP